MYKIHIALCTIMPTVQKSCQRWFCLRTQPMTDDVTMYNIVPHWLGAYLDWSLLCTLESHYLWSPLPFLPEAKIVTACVCVCVCLSVCLSTPNHCVSVKPEPLNLNKICKTTWLRSLLIRGWLTMTFRVKFNFWRQIYPILGLSMP